ncbi:Alpha/Beta hydrolase protein [Mycena latifolia]|nr:Alpha/Beta hydrolase protein [Mycena latifolia]
MPFAATTWGLSTSSRRAILLHGLTSESNTWHRVAAALVEQDYYVIAPDLLGHGHAPRAASYTIADFVTALLPALEPERGRVDLLIGHSLGGVIAMALIPHLLPAPKLRLVLVDPALDIDVPSIALIREDVVDETLHPGTVASYQAANPRWTEADCAIKVLGAVLCDPRACEQVCDQLSPWYFPVPELAPQVELFILGGDPACGAVVSLREHENFKAKRPDVKTGIVKGATHSVHREDPHAIVKVALSGDISPYAYGATQ